MPDHLALFVLGSLVVTVVPGPDMALVARQVVARGRAVAQLTILGNVTGLVVHTVALAAGLSALLVASATAFTAVKLAGAAYLVYLGIQALREARRANAPVPPAVPRRGNAYLQGLISTVLNPKPALFFLSYLPQFVDRDVPVLPQVVLLGSIHVVLGLVWLTVYARLISELHAALTRPRVKAAIERVTGAVLIALGVRVALER